VRAGADFWPTIGPNNISNQALLLSGGDSGIMTVDIAIDWKVYRTCDQVANFFKIEIFANLLDFVDPSAFG